MRPCTPAAVIALLDYYEIQVEGKHVVILGRSNIVGKPLALMLINRGATVTVCHSKTVDLTQYTKGADILCVAIGKPNFVKNHMVKEGSIVIDIGINQLNGKITGDVDYSDVFQRIGRITPVPGGIGALTSTLLMRNTLEAAKIL
jgi:methylenetetrahydrofolate dehydrogenase (NADP+)/methenyltetrahydrofolate cyclohydrolase